MSPQLRGGGNTAALLEHLRSVHPDSDRARHLLKDVSDRRPKAEADAAPSTPVGIMRYAKQLDASDQELCRRRELWLSPQSPKVVEWNRALALTAAVDLHPVTMCTQTGFRDIFLPTCCPQWYAADCTDMCCTGVVSY
jgi:hypothetical protein